MDKLFISWTSRDGVSEKIAEYFKLFFDTIFGENLFTFYSKQDSGGDENGWFAPMNDELRQTKFGVWILTQDAINSEWCCYELGSICNNNIKTTHTNKRIFPIKFAPNKDEKLDKNHTPFGQVGIFDFSRDSIELIVDAISEELYSVDNELSYYKAKDNVKKLLKMQWKILQKNCCEELNKQSNAIVDPIPGNESENDMFSSPFWMGRFLALEDYLVKKYDVDVRGCENRLEVWLAVSHVCKEEEKGMFDKILSKHKEKLEIEKKTGKEISENLEHFYEKMGNSDGYEWLKVGGNCEKILFEGILVMTDEYKILKARYDAILGVGIIP